MEKSLDTIQAELRTLIEKWCDRGDHHPLLMLGSFYSDVLRYGACIDGNKYESHHIFFSAVEDAILKCVLPDEEIQTLGSFDSFRQKPFVHSPIELNEPILWGDYSKSRIDPYKATVGFLNQLCGRREMEKLVRFLACWYRQDGSHARLLGLRREIGEYGYGVSDDIDQLAWEIFNTFDNALTPPTLKDDFFIDLEKQMEGFFNSEDDPDERSS